MFNNKTVQQSDCLNMQHYRVQNCVSFEKELYLPLNVFEIFERVYRITTYFFFIVKLLQLIN